MPTFGVK